MTGTKMFAWAFLLMGLFCLLLGTYRAILGIEAKNWPRAPGCIIISKAEPLRTSEKIRIAASCITLDYIYLVGKKVYDGHRLDSGWNCFSSSKRVKSLLKKYSTGTRVKVCYNPDNPEMAFLEPGLNWSIYFLWGVGLISVSTAWPMIRFGANR